MPDTSKLLSSALATAPLAEPPLPVRVETMSVPRALPRARWRGALGISLVAHTAVAVGLLFGLRQITPPPPAALSTAMAVQILPMPAAPSAPSHQTPPEPAKPSPEPVPAIERRELPPVPKLPNVKAAVVIPPKVFTPPQPTTPPPPPTPAQQAAPARTVAAPVQGTPTQGVTNAQQSYDAQIVSRLERKKRFPAEAMRQGLEDVVYVRMVIDRSGRITSSEIARSKHISMLDDAVRDLVRRVNPLPAIPKEIAGNSYTVTVPIDFFINRSRR